MDIRIRTAVISTGLNLILTALKFVLFSLTGSLAILAEAWHSFADVGTSLVVLIAVSRSLRSGSTREQPGDEVAGENDEQVAATTTGPARLLQLGRSANAEHHAALGIGLFLSVVAVGLLHKVLLAERAAINRPLLSGILFLCFAVGSYFVFRFETSVGREHGSLGLVSDGLHSKADMVGALLTGAAMIIYSLGVDLDRLVAAMIALFVLSFAVETLINTAASVLSAGTREPGDLRTVTIVLALCDKEKLRRAVLRFEENTSIPALDRLRTCRRSLRLLRWPATAALVLAYLSTCLYTVDPAQQAIVERLGRPLSCAEPIGPGLHLKAPWPIDRVIKVDVCTVRQLALGNISDDAAFALIWTREHGTGEPFLSGDNNFFFPYLVIHYRVKNIYSYVLQNANPDELLEGVTHGRISTLFASLPFDEIVGQERGQIETRIRSEVQRQLDELDSGIEILGAFLKDVHPPIFIADAFEYVIAARQEKQELINKAHGYRNQRLPESRGEAQRQQEQATAYVLQRVRHSEGDAERFLSRRVSEPRARRITERRLHLEAIAETIARTDTVVVDPAAGTPTLLMGGKTIQRSDVPPFLLGDPLNEEGAELWQTGKETER